MTEEKKPIVSKELLEGEMMKAMVESFGKFDPKDLLKMLVNQRMSFDASFEGTPLKIDLKFGKGEILARLRFEDGNTTET